MGRRTRGRFALWVAGGGAAFGLLMMGCGGRAAGPPSPALPAALVLRVDALEVSPTHPDSQVAWDGRESDTGAGVGCRVIVAGISMFEPALGSAASLCGLVSPSPGERHAEEPDLELRLGVGADAAYSSWVTRDSSSQSLQYEFVVPVAAVPADGLRLDVLDEDDQDGRELIGGVRLSRDKLLEGYQSASKLLVFSEGAVRRLELVVSAYTDEPVAVRRRPASAPPVELGRPVMAGELVNVRASGKFTVGSWFDTKLDPAGYPGDHARSYNLAPFKQAPHACAIALIGNRQNVEGVPIGLHRQFVAGHAGPLRVGLNDKDLDNNEGQVSFEVARRAPTAQEWLDGGHAKP